MRNRIISLATSPGRSRQGPLSSTSVVDASLARVKKKQRNALRSSRASGRFLFCRLHEQLSPREGKLGQRARVATSINMHTALISDRPSSPTFRPRVSPASLAVPPRVGATPTAGYEASNCGIGPRSDPGHPRSRMPVDSLRSPHAERSWCAACGARRRLRVMAGSENGNGWSREACPSESVARRASRCRSEARGPAGKTDSRATFPRPRQDKTEEMQRAFPVSRCSLRRCRRHPRWE